MSKFEFALFFVLINISGVVAQATLDVLLPRQKGDVIKLNISDVLDDAENSPITYDYLAVFVENNTKEYDANFIQGTHSIERNHLIFKPYFPFESGTTYVIRTKNDNLNSNYTYQSFQIGNTKKVEEAKVLSIYPSARLLPENLLRFYIYFKTPMKKGEALKHIKLLDANGNIDDHVFMTFKQELWSADGKRLTLLFDPGRIKRGVSTNVLRGPALQESQDYTLSISSSWQDVYGQYISPSSKKITVTKAYRNKINLEQWLLNKPKANSHDTLALRFDRIMDHALLQSMIQVKDAEENILNGYWEILNKEQQLQFNPKDKWNKGAYKIVIDSRLEDVAGNNLKALLDDFQTEENNTQAYQFIAFKL